MLSYLQIHRYYGNRPVVVLPDGKRGRIDPELLEWITYHLNWGMLNGEIQCRHARLESNGYSVYYGVKR